VRSIPICVPKQKKAIIIMPIISLMRDQTIQVNENWIKVAYMGSAAKYQQMAALALDPKIRYEPHFCHPGVVFY